MVSNLGTIGTIFLIIIAISSKIDSSVTSFRVYNEKRILDRLATAPLVSVSMSRRTGPVSSYPPEPSYSYDENPQSFEPIREISKKSEKKKRIRKVIRKVKTTTEDSMRVFNSSHDIISPLNNYNNRDIEIYERVRTRRKYGNRHTVNKDSDLQRAESGNPFINSSAPVSSDFAGEGENGLQFQIQILHPLLNSDSILSHKDPKLPEDKTVTVLHNLSEEVAGDIPITPDLKKLRRKQPLLNHDSIISGQIQVSKIDQNSQHSNGRNTGKISSKIRQRPLLQDEEKVTFVEPFNGRPSSTTYPPITSQTIPDRVTSTTTQRNIPTRIRHLTTTTTTVRPTIRLTSRPRTTTTTKYTTTTTTERPSTVILSPIPFTSTTSIPTERSPQIIIFPPGEEYHPTTYHDERIQTTTPGSTQQDILNLLGIGQSTSRAPGNHAPVTNTNNIFDLFNLFTPSTTPIPTNPPIPTTTTQAPVTKPPQPRHTTEKRLPPTTTTPVPSQAELDNLLQLALLEGLLQNGGAEGSKGQGAADLSSLLSFLGGTNTGIQNPTSPPIHVNPLPIPTSGTPLQSALNNMISVLTNPFGQSQQKQQGGLFGNNNNLFGGGNSGSNSLFGGGSSLFGGGNRGSSLFGGNPLFGNSNGGSSIFGNNGGSSLFGGNGGNAGNSLFGGNSIFNLNPGASSTKTTVVQRPNTTPIPPSDNELLAQLLQLVGDEQGKATSLQKGSKASQPQPSETMQLLNVLFNNQNSPPKPSSGPYWWLDMNAFMGGTPSSDPMAGIRPKLGQREYFLKVKK